MITDAVLGAFAFFAAWLPSLFPVVAVPSFVAGIPGAVSNVGVYLDGLNPWVPLDLVVAAGGVYAACLLAALVIRLVRIVASFLTAGGGSAA